jgi:citrate lyase subunit beta / citryl-CoA lyase
MASSAEVNAVKRGEAGRMRKDVRSDLHVAIEARESGGIDLHLTSRVSLYYGEAIRKQVLDVLAALEVTNARVEVTDEGALPFVIAARIEAAAKRAGLAGGKRCLPDIFDKTAFEVCATTKDSLRRSRLYLPGSGPKYFINAALHGPDGVILDLEDSVHHGEKDSARLLVRNALRAVDFGHCELMVRINQLPLGLEDLKEVIPQRPDIILIPKVETPEQIIEVDKAIDRIQQEHDPDRHPTYLMPILESALGIENAFAIATASDRVCALTIGLEDYTADLGVVKTSTGTESLYARTRVVNAAKAAGVQAIDSVFGDVGDMDGLKMWGEQSRALGFEGMGCIHPAQIPVIHAAFAPSEKEIEKALKIVAAFEDAQARGLGVVSLGSKMIDPPVVNRAVKLVQRAKQMGLVKNGQEATK